MNPLDLLYGAGGAWLAAALAGLLAGSRRPGLRACCALSALGGAAAAAGGGWSMVYGNTGLVTPGGRQTITGGPLQLQATSLAGVFVALLGLVAVAIAWYAPRYHEPGRGTAIYLAAYNLALLACLAVLAAGGMVTFLVAWETMSLACYLLILRHPRSDASARGAFWFLALSEIGFLLVVAAFVILSSKTHATSPGRDRGPGAPGRRRLAGRGLPARPGRVRVQGRARPAARVAARGAPGRARRRVRRSCPAWWSSSASTGSRCSRSGWIRWPGPGPDWSRWAPGR